MLIKNLNSLIKRVELRLTPVHITELWAYGSFIRPKEEPGDVDLMLFYKPDQELDHRVRLIRDFLHEGMNENKVFTEKVWGQAFKGKVDLLVEAVDQRFGQDQRHPLWLEASRAEWIRMAKSHGIYMISLEITKIIKAILLGKSRTLHIDPMSIKPLDEKAKIISERAYRLLWSEESKDLDTNLRLMQKIASDAEEKERPRFIEQFDQLDTEYEIIKMGVVYVLNQQKKGRDITKVAPSEIFEVVSNNPNFPRLLKHTTSSVMEAGMVNWAHETNIKNDFLVAALVAYPESYIKEFPDGPARTTPRMVNFDVEELRCRIKSLTRKLPFARTLRTYLSRISIQGDFASPDPVTEAVFLAYINTPMYLATDELRREVLQDFGLGHIMIPKRMDKGTTWDRYQRPSE